MIGPYHLIGCVLTRHPSSAPCALGNQYSRQTFAENTICPGPRVSKFEPEEDMSESPIYHMRAHTII